MGLSQPESSGTSPIALSESASLRGHWFLALVVPEGERLLAATSNLPPGMRCFSPSDLHITVGFLGCCGIERAMAAWQAMGSRRHAAIAIRPGGWRPMGAARRPSAYALTLASGHNTTAALIEGWRGEALAAAELPPEPRPALPHITLVRPCRHKRSQQPIGTAEVMARWLSAAPIPRARLLLREIALYGWAMEREQRLVRNQQLVRDPRLFTILRRRHLDQPEILPLRQSDRH